MTINDLLSITNSLIAQGGFFKDQIPDLLGDFPDQSARTYERAIEWGRCVLDARPDAALRREVEKQMKKWTLLLHKHPTWLRSNTPMRPTEPVVYTWLEKPDAHPQN